MAKFKSNIDLQKNQLLQAAFENRANHPPNPVVGQVYFSTQWHKLLVCASLNPVVWSALGDGQQDFQDPIWIPVTVQVLGSYDVLVTIDSGYTDYLLIARSLITCFDINGYQKCGYVVGAVDNESGSVNCQVVMNAPLESTDSLFQISIATKVDNFGHRLSIPGILIPDKNRYQGEWLANIPNQSIILGVDASVCGSGSGENNYLCINISCGSLTIFAEDVLFQNNEFKKVNLIPDIKNVVESDTLRLLIMDQYDSVPAADFQATIYLVPHHIFRKP